MLVRTAEFDLPCSPGTADSTAVDGRTGSPTSRYLRPTGILKQMRLFLFLAAALGFALGCGDNGAGPGPAPDRDGARLAGQLDGLADSVDAGGYSPAAEALRHAAEIVRLTGHAHRSA